jgi:hypothetical protein
MVQFKSRNTYRFVAVAVDGKAHSMDDVLAPRFGAVAEAGRELELQPHHRQARIGDCRREFSPKSRGPEAACPATAPTPEPERIASRQ